MAPAIFVVGAIAICKILNLIGDKPMPSAVLFHILGAMRILIVTIGVITSGASVSSANSFPRSVSHAFGETIISKEPVRVVTLGWSGEDALLALGIQPVGMTRYRFFESGMFPWVEARIGNSAPLLLSGELDYEEIAALRPDLILSVYSGMDHLSFQRLSAIAPTVAYRSGPWKADWKEQLELVGDAVGKLDQARVLVSKTTAVLSTLADTYPVMAGKSFTFGTYFGGGNNVVIYLPSDPRVKALTEMGFVSSAGVADLEKKHPGETSVAVSLEEISLIDADVLIMWYGEGARAAAEAQPLFNTVGAVKRGSYVALEDPVDVWSTSALSVLSIPYGFPRFVPRLAEAARRSQE
ncbi:iron-siderophore ABC transporter substrate-binding protein [Agrobacterium sp. AGB01]|uniref:iron-siderophore ABC transporter substrate-binding protein n=1 Tax=Agrobacterium sp. AGB01 TaxID=2769302 RepID=UPI001FEE4F74|nr:iron-siderophore ABC transporter substrate-binding protein [Agrobacterium sp. AGB01]